MAFLIRLLIAGALMLLAYVAWTVPSPAHSWYPYNCCSDRDCRHLPPGSVKITADGFLVHVPGGKKATLIPFGDHRVKEISDKAPPDEQQMFHVCTTAGDPDGYILCFFVPQGGA